jgi:hypothetical protein
MARSKITNTSGEERHFGWAPPHGVTLADGEETVFDGDLRSILAGGLNRYNRKRELAGLDADVDAGNVLLEDVADPSSSLSP